MSRNLRKESAEPTAAITMMISSMNVSSSKGLVFTNGLYAGATWLSVVCWDLMHGG